MKKYLILFLSSAFLFSCKKDLIEGNGEIKTEVRALNNFFNIDVSGSSKVFVTQGTQYSVSVKAYENIIPLLETKSQNGTLFIGFKDNANINNDNSEVTITMPSLTGISISGSGAVTTAGQFLGSENFVAQTSGSGNIFIGNGTATNLLLKINGSGNVKAFGLQVQRVEAQMNGSGNAEVSVSKTLNATLTGSGNIYYKGTPEVFSKITGSGQVIKQ